MRHCARCGTEFDCDRIRVLCPGCEEFNAKKKELDACLDKYQMQWDKLKFENLFLRERVWNLENPKHNDFVHISLERYQELIRHEQVVIFVIGKLYDFERYGSVLNKSEVSQWLTKANHVLEGRIK